MDKTAFALSVLMFALPSMGRAQTPAGLMVVAEQPVVHAPLDPGVEPKVRSYVQEMASTLGAFYPDTEFRNVRAVYFQTGAVIVCGELNRTSDKGLPQGWRYFSNSGPLIFESDKQEVLCDQRTYAVEAVTDDYEYGPEFTLAARR